MSEAKTILVNKKAGFLYHLLDRYKAGMQLTGTEVKSVRGSQLSLSDSYCVIKNGEIYVKNMHIAVYKFGSFSNHEPRRERKLLLKRREINRIHQKLKEKGLTLIPVEIFISERGLIKIEIALARGKKAFDKRHSIKEKDMKRDADRSYKY